MPRALIPLLLLLAGALAPARRPEWSSQAVGSESDRARELAERTIANQHRDDRALYLYERLQRRVSYAQNSIVSDETYRLVPTGTGRLSLLVARANQPVGADAYRKELRDWGKVLERAVNPNDPREIRSRIEQRRRDEDRTELIDAIGKAFRFTWLDEETEGGRKLARIALDPNPAFQPTSRKTEIFRHVRATVWIDERAAQLVHGQAEIVTDVFAGGGMISRIYRGGWFRIEQSDIAPDVWLPTREEISLRGRMLLFGMDEHKLTETSHYRFVGTPRQAFDEVHRELAGGSLPPQLP